MLFVVLFLVVLGLWLVASGTLLIVRRLPNCWLARFLTSPVDGMLKRLAFMLAFIASGVLCLLVYKTAKASVPSPVNGAAGAWLIMCFSPFWLGLCLLAALCGYKLGRGWRVAAWLPLLFGLLGSLIINTMF